MGNTISRSIIELAELNTMLFEYPEAINVKVNLIKDELHLSRYRANSSHIAQKMLETNRASKTIPFQLPLSA
jgi:hypothetical protein